MLIGGLFSVRTFYTCIMADLKAILNLPVILKSSSNGIKFASKSASYVSNSVSSMDFDLGGEKR
jgi:hypothetical protein